MAYGSGLYGVGLYGVTPQELTAENTVSATEVTAAALGQTHALSVSGALASSTAVNAPEINQDHQLTAGVVASATGLTDPDLGIVMLTASPSQVTRPTLWTGGRDSANWADADSAGGIWTDATEQTDNWQEVA